MSEPAVLHVVGNDQVVRRALVDGLFREGLSVEVLTSAEALIDLLFRTPRPRRCLLLALDEPQRTEPRLTSQLRQAGLAVSVIPVNGAVAIPAVVSLLRDRRASDLQHPFSTRALLDGLRAFLAQPVREKDIDGGASQEGPQLTRRERDVLIQLLRARTSGETSLILGVGFQSVRQCRQRVLEKLRARSVLEVVLANAALHRPDLMSDRTSPAVRESRPTRRDGAQEG